MDPIGNLLFAPAVISLLLALQWGGINYDWKNGRIIALLVVFGVLLIAWLVVQFYGQEKAMVPPRIFLQRSIIAGFTFSLCIGGVTLALSYYLAVWFQAVKGVDALQSGIRTLPFVLGLVAAAIASGVGISKIGYYAPFVIACSCLMSIGVGLMTTMTVNSGSSQWIGYQFLAGFGMGLGMQQTGMAAQVVLKREDVPIGVALGFVGQSLGGSIFVAAAQQVFIKELAKDLSSVLPAASAKILAGVGATSLRDFVPPDSLPSVLVAYNKAIMTTFYVAVGVACFSIVPALGFEWRSVKGMKGKGGMGGKGGT
jgi:Fungal trichothecene efflux pump (TRI12)